MFRKGNLETQDLSPHINSFVFDKTRKNAADNIQDSSCRKISWDIQRKKMVKKNGHDTYVVTQSIIERFDFET